MFHNTTVHRATPHHTTPHHTAVLSEQKDPHCPLPVTVWQCTEGSQLPRCRPHQCPARAWRHIGLGPSRTSVAPSGRVARCPQGSLGRKPPSTQESDSPRPQVHQTLHTAGIYTHSPPVLHYPYAGHPSHCHWVTAPSAHHTTPHHTTPHHTTPHHTTPHHTTPHHTTPHHTTPQSGPSVKSVIPHRGHKYKEAPVRSRAGTMSSMRPQRDPAQGPGFQRGPSELPHGGHDFKEAPLRSRTGAMTSKRPQCAPAQGPGFQ